MPGDEANGRAASPSHGTMSARIEVGAGFHPDLTGRENIFLNGAILGMKKDRIKKKFDEIVEFAGLGDFIDTPVKRYSSGMYARLGFSVAAHVEPEILIVDEVLSVGDYVFQKKCAERMKSIVKDGVAIVFVSHNLRAIMEMCEQCILLDHGKILAHGPAAEVVREHLDRGQTETARRNWTAFLFPAPVSRPQRAGATIESGEKATLNIDITAGRAYEHLFIAVVMHDASMYAILDLNGAAHLFRLFH